MKSFNLPKRRIASCSLSLIFLLTLSRDAGALTQQNVPKKVQSATDLGPVGNDEEMNVTVYLKMTDRSGFEAAIEQLYNPASPTYQKWMTDADLKKYAPSAAAVATVKQELEKNGLTVTDIDPLGFYIRVHGAAANVQNAFHTQIHQFTAGSQTFRAHVLDAHLSPEADAQVSSVSGLESFAAHPQLTRARNPQTNGVPASIPLKNVEANGGFSSVETDICFTGPSGFVYTTNGGLPIATYVGNVYDNSTLTCGFTSRQLESHYGLSAAYAKGYNGTGQTVVLLEAYGYPNALNDANAFSALSGLPALNATNFEIVYPEGPPKNPNAGVLLGWDVEIALDIQWAHTIAPNAKIVLVAAAGQDNEDLQYAMSYIVNHGLGYTVNDSWEIDSEMFAGPLEPAAFNDTLALAAAKGVSFNFATGDSGDNGNGSPIGAPDIPSDSPYATAVGGTSILNIPNTTDFEELGWGNAATYLELGGATVDPPLAYGQLGGAGGGESVFFSKPSWQSALPGTGRQLPDVSALADPYTGVAIVISVGGTQFIEAGWGGTSVACPIVTAFWALAQQYAGHPLGQAARKIATMTSTEINDIVPTSSPGDVSGIVADSAGSTYYSSYDLFAPFLPSPIAFVSAIWQLDPFDSVALSFGTDTSLTVAKGWDNVTGFGVPKGLAFIEGAK